ncbi:MAG: DUF4340 domain-containing protein [Polyangiaceae bacterium]|nr:DUF4340 domain-containing protein [Polyangiaceae bacterium]MCW5791459.1 DUF4340 domain-containing protein [Polyangiaceae bacterium]
MSEGRVSTPKLGGSARPGGALTRRLRRSLALHGGLLLVAATVGYLSLGKPAAREAASQPEVVIAAGKPTGLTRVELTTPTRSVVLEAQQDAAGRYYTGQLTRAQQAPPAPDAGAPTLPSPPETQRFVAVTAAEKLAEQLAPLRAYRSLGPLPDSRLAEFGLDKPEGTLKLTLGGTVHELILGGTTPGGADRYVKHAQTGVGYAIVGSIVRDLEAADARLTERSLQGFEPERVTLVRISEGERQRELVPIQGSVGSWADASEPGRLDETAGNWMLKLGRLRPNSYASEAAPEGSTQVVKVEYFEGRRSLGDLILVRAPADRVAEGGPEAAKAAYYVRTSHTRWFASVIGATGEQVDQDLGSVLR